MILIESEEDLLSREMTIDVEDLDTEQSGGAANLLAIDAAIAALNAPPGPPSDKNMKGGDDVSVASTSSLLSVPKGLACARQ